MLLRIVDVAERLAVSRDTVYRLIDRGELPAILVGAAKRVEPDAVQRYIDAHRTVSNP